MKNQNSFIDTIQNFKTYSQLYEDLILFYVFHDVKNGFYIDIGANDPNIKTVTKFFYLNGWNGINIEPLPDKYDLLTKFRPKDINLKIGVGKNKGIATLYLSGTCSTINKKFSQIKRKKINITIDTMSNVCKKYIKPDIEIEFCKIDVEGEEKNVLLGYNFEKYRPKIFIIESTFPGTNISCHNEWEYILLKHDYSFVYQYKINRFYIDNKRKNLERKFWNIDKYINLYKKMHLKKKEKKKHSLFITK